MPQLVELFKKGVNNPEVAAKYILDNVEDSIFKLGVFLNSELDVGENIFDDEWDMLILLDGCRTDALNQVSGSYDFLNEPIDGKRSVGGNSLEWMTNTFHKRYLNKITNTAYVTANPHSQTVLENQLSEDYSGGDDRFSAQLKKWGNTDIVSPADLSAYEPVWKLRSEKLHGGARPARPVTDRAIQLDRNESHDRLVLHYMQPHSPYFATGLKEGRELFEYEINPVQATTKREIREAYSSYVDTLRWILDEVAIVLQNVDRRKVILTSDHGQVFGRYYTYWQHTHKQGSFHPKIRNVSWAVTEAEDTASHEPETWELESDRNVEELLSDLGYL